MRIMHVITGLTTGGAEMMLLKFLSACGRDWDHIVVSLADEGTLGPRISELGIPVHSLGLRRSIANPVRALSIIRLTRRLRPQLIQGWMPHGNLMASLAGVSSQERVPVLWNIRMCLYDMAAEPLLTAATIRLGAFLSRHPAAIIYNSEIGAKQHERLGYHAARQVVIPNGFDCQMFRPDSDARRQVRAELGVGNDTILIGLIARYHPMKDHAGFLRSAALVAKAHPPAYFLFAGAGMASQEPTLLKIIAEHQLQGRTLLLGERSDMPRLTAALDIACSASWGEGFSNTIGEAMSCGIPCVVTDVGDSTYLVADTGVSVPPRSPEALAQAICGMIDAGSEHRRNLGAAARRRIEAEFSLPAIARRYEDLYQEHLTCFR
jgi:glycosyltransferase involved in cell wall biosynthesis